MKHGKLCTGTRRHHTEGCVPIGYCVGGQVGRHVGSQVGVGWIGGGPVGRQVGGKVGVGWIDGGPVGRLVGGMVGEAWTSGHAGCYDSVVASTSGHVRGAVGLVRTLYILSVTIANILANNFHEP